MGLLGKYCEVSVAWSINLVSVWELTALQKLLLLFLLK